MVKLILYRVDARRKRAKAKMKINAERFLFLSFIIIFAIMIVVQAALMNPVVRTSLSLNDELEGKPLGIEEYIYNEGTVNIYLLNMTKNPQVKILVNGEEVGAFDENSKVISVKDGDVVEIDASAVFADIEVAIRQNSGNISAECVDKGIIVNSDIKKLTRIRID